MTRVEQRRRVLRARVALALYCAYGRVPNEQEIDQAYCQTSARYKITPDTRLIRRRQPAKHLVLW